MMTKEQIQEICEGILNVLTVNPSIPMSWGLENMQYTRIDGMHGIIFDVNGFLHQGKVAVVLDLAHDYYVVYIINKDGSFETKLEMVSFDYLVELIDTHIECGSSEEEKNQYDEKVRESMKNLF